MGPRLFRSASHVIPPVYHLLWLIDCFPPLKMNDSWTLQWLLDLQLQALLQNLPDSSDLLCYDAIGLALLASRASVRPSRPLLLRPFDELFLFDHESASNWVLQPHILCVCRFVAPSPVVPAPSSCPLVSSYLPTLCDCMTVDGVGAPIIVTEASLKAIHQPWTARQDPVQVSVSFVIPSPLLLPAPRWKLF
ncbi:hypothetical protein A0J61_01302 [Choanephora cucurbitarum]|uniref:Uncharacterized protein n=1 Tax=Choanephora cucurbitarum TaxID=101091 RepID=A0A1C7NP37_9FUNG|nr:hypothetical protein A0J61_01302 [Choanephora cucurbitarum]